MASRFSLPSASLEPPAEPLSLADSPDFLAHLQRLSKDCKTVCDSFPVHFTPAIFQRSPAPPVAPESLKTTAEALRGFLFEHSPALPHINTLSNTFLKLQQLENSLAQEISRCHAMALENFQRRAAYQEKQTTFEENRRYFLKKMQNYLNLPKSTKPDKLDMAALKMQARKQKIDLERLELAKLGQQISGQKDFAIAKPLAGVLSAYAAFFQAGNSLFSPLTGVLSDLTTFLAQEDSRLQKAQDVWDSARKSWEFSTDSFKSIIAGATGPEKVGNSLGIRDLDASLRLLAQQNKSTEKSGYLYIPAGNFQQVYCEIRAGKMIFTKESEHGGNSQQIVDLLLCSVKECRDFKIRFVFQLISPVESWLLQAESAGEMNDWLTVIQNAISGELNAGDSGGDGNAGQLGSPRNSSKFPTVGNSPNNPFIHQSGLPFSPMAFPVPAGDALAALRAIEGNSTCADCDAANPDWISLNLGILICMECSGIHRALGVHISKIRSLQLDKLDGYALEFLSAIGNSTSKKIWENSLISGNQARPNALANRANREMWIRAKYEIKSFLGPGNLVNSPDLQERWNLALFTAIETGNLFLLLQALAAGGSAEWPNPAQENRSALHQAVMFGSPVLSECLIHYANQLSLKELRGWSPLHYAVYQEDLECTELLLLRGGTGLVQDRDNDGRTVLEAAEFHGGPEWQGICREIIKAAINKKKNQGKNAT